MTPQQIRDAIAASPELQALAVAGDTQAIADALSVGRTKIVSHFASERGILERHPLGPLAADALMTKLENFAATAHPMASIVKRAMRFLGTPEGLDIGAPTTRGLLAQLTLGEVLTEGERAGLQAMATVADPISSGSVLHAVASSRSSWSYEVLPASALAANVMGQVRFTGPGAETLTESVPGNDLTQAKLVEWAEQRRILLEIRSLALATFS